MRGKVFQAISTVLMGLFIYSCSELILPKQVEVKGTLNVPISAGAANLGSLLAERIRAAFPEDLQGAKVYDVDYPGQTVQTFCIYFPIEMTEDINPDHFLKTIDEQINAGIAEPKPISVTIPPEISIPPEIPIPPGVSTPTSVFIRIPINTINDNFTIPPVSLADMARYVKSIYFNDCNGFNESAGIGINFYLTKIYPGLKMTLKCDELGFSDDSKDLEEGDNIFGNEQKLQPLDLSNYKNDAKKLNFTVNLQSSSGDGYWQINASGLKPGDSLIEGEIRFFYKWTKAEIDLAAAIKASPDIDDNLTGKFPDTAIDLSEMNKYFKGGLTFNDLEFKIYMDGPTADVDVINSLQAKLQLNAQYSTTEETFEKPVYDHYLIVNSEPLNLDDYLDNDSYTRQHLPEYSSENNDGINNETVKDVFSAMPADLFFTYKIELADLLIITPDMFSDDVGNSAEGSKITTAVMIMLPMSLTATGDDDNKSIISLPDMFGNGDLFGREEPEDFFKAADIDYIIMTVDFTNQIFTGGNLFINENNDLFPQGVSLNGSRTVLFLANEQIEKIRRELIKPDIRIEIDKDGTIHVPKSMGVFNIKFEMKSRINLGELIQ
jgi:hypothetical protein